MIDDIVDQILDDMKAARDLPDMSSMFLKKEVVNSMGLKTQWGNDGKIFTATTNTNKILPSDCYRLSVNQSGSVAFISQCLTTDKLLRLPDSKSDEVISEIEKFWPLKERFKEYGFSHKRGFLLHGPAGSGKTSTLQLVIQDILKRNGIALLGDAPILLAAALADLREVEPERQLVVVLEDIDTIIKHYGESAVLSVLDGEHQVENVVYIATTNYPEDLDGRITNRPSRFDKIVKIGMPSDDARSLYLMTKLGTTVYDGIDLVKETDGLSIAHLKELIVSVYCQNNNVVETLTRLKNMKITPKSTMVGSIFGLARD